MTDTFIPILCSFIIFSPGFRDRVIGSQYRLPGNSDHANAIANSFVRRYGGLQALLRPAGFLCLTFASNSVAMGKPSASFLRSDLPSKADRKFEKKLQFYSKVRDAVASLSATKSIAKKKKLRSRQKKLKVYDLSTLSESLPELKGPKQPPAAPKFKLNCKSRTELVINEARRLSEVLSNPNYQKDPLGYIYQHLQKTLPITEEIPKKNTNKDRGRKKKKKSKKNKASASGAPVSMDV